MGDADSVVDRIEEFLTGNAMTRRRRPRLATVVFGDIVESARRRAAR
jgi:hypothetical protein